MVLDSPAAAAVDMTQIQANAVISVAILFMTTSSCANDVIGSQYSWGNLRLSGL
jgi:hypothetical protein